MEVVDDDPGDALVEFVDEFHVNVVATSVAEGFTVHAGEHAITHTLASSTAILPISLLNSIL